MPIAPLLLRVVRPAFRKRSPASASLLGDWIGVVGPGLGAQTRPIRLQAGTLSIGCSGPMALELQHRETALIERINLALGAAAVTRLRFVHERVVPPGDAPVARPLPAPGEAAPAPVEGVGDALGAALGRLRASIASREQRVPASGRAPLDPRAGPSEHDASDRWRTP